VDVFATGGRGQNISILDFVGVDDERGDADNWIYKTCKALVESTPLTKHHLAVYRPDALFVTSPRVSEHWRGKCRNVIDLLTPRSPERGLPTLSLITKGFWLTCNRVDMALVGLRKTVDLGL